MNDSKDADKIVTATNTRYSRRQFTELCGAGALGILAGGEGWSSISIAALDSAASSPPLEDPRTLMATAMPVGRRRVEPWFACPRIFIKDSGRSELGPSEGDDSARLSQRNVPDTRDWEAGPRKKGEIAQLVRRIAAQGGNAFRLSIYWGGEVYYQSNVAPHAPGLGDIDYLQEAMAEGRHSGIHIIAYMNPNCLYENHPLYPEAVIRKNDGSVWPVKSYGTIPAAYACVNNPPFRKFLLDIIEEIFRRYEPSGLYLDGLTPHICYCNYCRAIYREMFRRELPAKFEPQEPEMDFWEMSSTPQLVGDLADPDSGRLTRLLMQSLYNVTRDITGTLKRIRPDAVVIYHSWPKPSLLPYYDGAGSEIYLDRPFHHTLWKDEEFASFAAAVPVLMIHDVYLQHRTDCEARHKMVQALANGLYPTPWSFRGMKPIFEFVKAHEQYFDWNRTVPVRDVALIRDMTHSSIQDRLAGKSASDIGQERAGFDRFLSPYVGFYSLLLHAHVPMATLHPCMIENHLEGYRVICLANEVVLSRGQLDTITQFVKAGGGLIVSGQTSLYDEAGQQRSDFGLAQLLGARYQGLLACPAAVGPEIGSSDTPWRVDFTADHAVTQNLSREKIPILQDVVVLQPAGAQVVARIRGAGLPAEGIPAVLVQQYGQGHVVYLNGGIDSSFSRWLDPVCPKLIANAVEWCSQGRLSCRASSSRGRFSVRLYDQAGCRIIHLVNHTADPIQSYTEIHPVDQLAVDTEIPAGRIVASVRALWTGQILKYQVARERLHVLLPRLGEYEVLIVEWK